MAIFGNKTSEKSDAPASNSFAPSSTRTKSSAPQMPTQVNMIGKGASIDGKIRVQGDVRVGGKVKGEIHVEGKLVVTPEGIVEGRIEASEAEIGGLVKGDIICHGRLVLRQSARLEGNIVAAKLAVEDGAVFIGQCEMGTEPARTASKKKPSVPASTPVNNKAPAGVENAGVSNGANAGKRTLTAPRK
jgi:cytoskeletal protein CcmA (bactofilin family)